MGAGASTTIREQILMGGRLETLAHRCENLFEDDEFDIYGSSALGTRFVSQLLRYPDEEIHWVRPQEFGDGNLYRPGQQDFNFSTITGAVEGCARDLSPVIQALCTARPEYLKSVFVSYNSIVGCCVCRLFHNGQFELVIIDDRIPCRRVTRDEDDEQERGKPKYEPISTHTKTGEAWLPLLEKAMAKLYGSYSATALGDGARDLFKDLLGEHAIDIGLGKPESPESKKLFSAMQSRFSKSELVVTARKSSVSSRTWADPQRVSAVLNFSVGVDEDTLVDVRGAAAVDKVNRNGLDISFKSIPREMRDEDSRLGLPLQYICVAIDDELTEIVDEEEVAIAKDMSRKIEDAKEAHPHVDDGRNTLFGMVKCSDSIGGKNSAAKKPKREDEPRYQWLRWSQFCEDYERMTVCIVSSEGHMCVQSPSIHAESLCTIKGNWDSKAGTAGGGHHLKTWRNSPLFRVQMEHNNAKLRGKLLLSVSLPDGRRVGESMGADSDDWNGDQDQGGKLLYPAHALYVCKDEPCLENIIVNTDYFHQRDVTVEMSIDTAKNGPFKYLLVPCTQEDDVDHDFNISACFLAEDGSRKKMAINRVGGFDGFNYSAKVYGKWMKGQSAMGPISGHNEWSALNPCWKMHILGSSGPGFGDSIGSPGPSVSMDSVLGSDPDITRAVNDDDATAAAFGDRDGDGYGATTGLGQAPSVILEGQSESKDQFFAMESVDDVNKDIIPYESVGLVGGMSVASNDTGPYSPVRLARKDDKPTVRHFQVCTLLSPNNTTDFGDTGSRPSSPGFVNPSGAPADYLRSGTYLLTPNAFARLLHRKGACNEMHVNDGFLGKFRFNSYPVTTRKEKFCVFSGGARGHQFLHRGSDVYEDIFIMPALNDKGSEGSFMLEVMSNLPFELEPVDLSRVPHPLKDLKNANAAKSAALVAATRRKPPKIAGFTPASTPIFGVGDTQTSFSRGLVTDLIEKTSVHEEELDIQEEMGEGGEEGKASDANQSVRQSLCVIKKSIASQIRQDTKRRVMAITLKQMTNEDQLEKSIKAQYEQARLEEEAMVNNVLSGGAHDV
jgi:hypothetical protein